MTGGDEVDAGRFGFTTVPTVDAGLWRLIEVPESGEWRWSPVEAVATPGILSRATLVCDEENSVLHLVSGFYITSLSQDGVSTRSTCWWDISAVDTDPNSPIPFGCRTLSPRVAIPSSAVSFANHLASSGEPVIWAWGGISTVPHRFPAYSSSSLEIGLDLNGQADVVHLLSPSARPNARFDGCSALIDEQTVIVAGGSGFGDPLAHEFTYHNDVWLYSLVFNIWTYLPSTGNPDPFTGAASVYQSSEARLWVFAPRTDETCSSTQLWSFSLVSMAWTHFDSTSLPLNYNYTTSAPDGSYRAVAGLSQDETRMIVWGGISPEGIATNALFSITLPTCTDSPHTQGQDQCESDAACVWQAGTCMALVDELDAVLPLCDMAEDCFQCTLLPHCGWCGGTDGSCMASKSSTCPDQNWGNTSLGSCSTVCEEHSSSCNDCMGNRSCGTWCPSSDVCLSFDSEMQQQQSGNGTELCIEPLLFTCPIPCSEFNGECADCVTNAYPACGFCGDTGECIQANGTLGLASKALEAPPNGGPIETNSSSVGVCWAYAESDVGQCIDSCSDMVDCESCASVRHCGWCGTQGAIFGACIDRPLTGVSTETCINPKTLLVDSYLGPEQCPMIPCEAIGGVSPCERCEAAETIRGNDTCFWDPAAWTCTTVDRPQDTICVLPPSFEGNSTVGVVDAFGENSVSFQWGGPELIQSFSILAVVPSNWNHGSAPGAGQAWIPAEKAPRLSLVVSRGGLRPGTWSGVWSTIDGGSRANIAKQVLDSTDSSVPWTLTVQADANYNYLFGEEGRQPVSDDEPTDGEGGASFWDVPVAVQEVSSAELERLNGVGSGTGDEMGIPFVLVVAEQSLAQDPWFNPGLTLLIMLGGVLVVSAAGAFLIKCSALGAELSIVQWRAPPRRTRDVTQMVAEVQVPSEVLSSPDSSSSSDLWRALTWSPTGATAVKGGKGRGSPGLANGDDDDDDDSGENDDSSDVHGDSSKGVGDIESGSRNSDDEGDQDEGGDDSIDSKTSSDDTETLSGPLSSLPQTTRGVPNVEPSEPENQPK